MACDAAGHRIWVRVTADAALANALAKVANVIWRYVKDGHEFYADYPFHDSASAVAQARAMYNGPQKAFNDLIDKRCWIQMVNEAEFRVGDAEFTIEMAKLFAADGRRYAAFGDATANRSRDEWIARNKALDYIASTNGQTIVVVNGYGYMYKDNNGKLVTTDHLVSTPTEYEWFGNWMQDRYQFTSSKPYVFYAESQTSDAVFRGADRLCGDAVACNILDRQYPWLLGRGWYMVGKSWGHRKYQINDALPKLQQTVIALP